MRTRNNVQPAESFLRRGGLLAVVLAIIWGFLAMHVVAAHTAPMSSHSVSGAPMLAGTTGHAVHGTTHAAPAAGSPTGASLEHRLTCDCSSSDCTEGASTHEDCVPAPGAPIPALPPPGTLTVFSAGAAFAAIQEHTAEGRIPDPPSPEQLSISRT